MQFFGFFIAVILVGVVVGDNKETSQIGEEALGSVPTNKRPRGIETVARMEYLRRRQFPGLPIGGPRDGNTAEDILDVGPGSQLQRSNDFISDPSWTPWSDWTACSRTCGVGVSSRSRKCVSSYSTSTPLSCNGGSTENKLCNTQDCAVGTTDFREAQCSQQNGKFFLSRNFKWIPFSGKDGNTCELTCMATNYHFYQSFGKAIDGTKCGEGGKKICIAGTCSALGCDGVIGSDVSEDVCGVCGGHNDTCYRYQNVVDRLPGTSLNSDYNKVATIPIGSTSVNVDDYNKNYLALVELDGEEQNYVINGNWIISWPGEYKVAGSSVKYSRKNERETFEIKGPTTKVLQIMVLCLGRQQPLIQYEYYKPATKSEWSDRFAEFKMQKNTIIEIPDEEDYREQIRAAGLDFDAVQPPTNEPITESPTTTTTAISTTATTEQPTVAPRRGSTRVFSRTSSCSSCTKKSVNWKKQFCDSDFAILVRVLPSRRLQKRRYTRYEVEILHVYKKNVRILKREFVWLPTNCCQRLRPYRHYFMMGRKVRVRVNDGVYSGTMKKSYQHETRLLVDRSEFWYMWRKYQAKTARIVRNTNCKRHKYLTTRENRRKSRG